MIFSFTFIIFTIKKKLKRKHEKKVEKIHAFFNEKYLKILLEGFNWKIKKYFN